MAEGAFDDQLTRIESCEYICMIFLGAGSVFGQELARALDYTGLCKYVTRAPLSGRRQTLNSEIYIENVSGYNFRYFRHSFAVSAFFFRYFRYKSTVCVLSSDTIEILLRKMSCLSCVFYFAINERQISDFLYNKFFLRRSGRCWAPKRQHVFSYVDELKSNTSFKLTFCTIFSSQKIFTCFSKQPFYTVKNHSIIG